MINEILSEGRENARTGRELAKFFDCDVRTITEQIERERREGQPICASTDPERPGYYLTADPDELKSYCNRLYHRGGELFKTRRALLDTLEKLLAKKEQEAAAAGGQKTIAGV